MDDVKDEGREAANTSVILIYFRLKKLNHYVVDYVM